MNCKPRSPNWIEFADTPSSEDSMLVYQPYDGKVITNIPLDDSSTVAHKLDLAVECFADRANWLPTFRRIEILKRLAHIVERETDGLALLIAREGGKPLTDASV